MCRFKLHTFYIDGELLGAKVFDETHKDNFDVSVNENKLTLGGFATSVVLAKWR